MLELGVFNRPRLRLVRQTEFAECGLACITMIAGFHQLDVDLGTMRRRFGSSMSGSTLRSLITIADAIGLVPRAVKLPLDQLSNLHVPALLHWDLNHYVVLEQIKGNKALIHDPVGRSIWMPMAEVSEHFTGVVLELRPSDDFETGRHRESLRLSHLWRQATGLKRSATQVLLLSIVLQIFVLASPYYMQLAIDSALPSLDHDLLTVLALGFGLIVIVNASAALLRAFVLLVAGTTLGFGMASNIARHLFRLPIEWFEKRYIGDILSRFQSVGPIQILLTHGAVAALIDGAMAFLTFALMIYFSLTLAIVAMTALAFYAIIRLLSFSFEREAKEGAIIAHGKEQSVLIESLRGIATLRLFGRETLRHTLWQNRLTEAVNADASIGRIGIWQTAANTLIFGLENVVAIWLAVGFVIDGAGFSVGMVFAYMSYKTQFIQKASSLIDQGIALRVLGLHLERLSDIALTEPDKGFHTSSQIENLLKGGIELKNVSYRYAPGGPLILDGLNFFVEPGAHVAITGPSGGGKSTLVKLLLGLIDPEAGEFRVDGLPLERFGHRRFQSQVGAVLQGDHLFAGSLAENIALFDDQCNMELVVAASTAASIHDDIVAMPMQYETLVGDMGSALSGGQKQRILLARALYRKPRVLIMDEGTSHLDAVHEEIVHASIAAMGITLIIVAHRQETIAKADKVFVLQDGKISDALPNVN